MKALILVLGIVFALEAAVAQKASPLIVETLEPTPTVLKTADICEHYLDR